MKKIGLSSVLAVFLLMQTGATAKLEAYEVSCPSAWFGDKKECLEPVTFDLLYPIPFYKTGVFKWGAIGVTAVVTSILLVPSGGASSVPGATLIGGLLGSTWTAGLATLGGGTLASGGFGMVGGAIVIATTTDLAIAGLISFAIPEDNLAGRKYNNIKIPLPKKIGSDTIRELYDDIEDITDSFMDEELSNTAYEQKIYADYVDALNSVKPTETAYDLINGAVLSFNLGKYAKSQYYLNQAINVFPEKSSFLSYLQALLYLVDYDIDGAILNLDKAIEFEPDALNPYLLKIQIALDNNRFTLAKETVDKGLEGVDDDNFQLNYLGGMISYHAKNYSEAIEYYKEALANTTEDAIEAESKIWIARCYKNLKNTKKANEWFKDAMSEVEDNKEYQNKLSSIYHKDRIK